MAGYQERKKNYHKGYTAYIIYAVVVIISIIIVYATGTASSVNHTSDSDLERDGFLWQSTPQHLDKQWEKEGYRKIINTPGSIIGVQDDGISRIDTSDGGNLWEYKRDDGKLCDAENVNGNVLAIFDSGKGCSEFIQLDAATGDYLSTAEYATDAHYVQDDKELSIVSQQEEALVLTKHHARLLRDDLVTESEFGDQLYPTNGDDQEHHDCTISDGSISTDGYAVAAQCDDNDTYNIYYMNSKPDESTESDVELEINTKSTQPVTIPAMSKAMVNFVVPGTPNSVYTWELTKDQSEVAHNYVKVNEFGYEYQDIPSIGYVWRIGNTLHVRHGSEDLSQSQTLDNVIGDPIEVDGELMVPQLGEIMMWNIHEDTYTDIQVDGLNGKVFGFAGDTLVSFDNGKIIGYK